MIRFKKYNLGKLLHTIPLLICMFIGLTPLNYAHAAKAATLQTCNCLCNGSTASWESGTPFNNCDKKCSEANTEVEYNGCQQRGVDSSVCKVGFTCICKNKAPLPEQVSIGTAKCKECIKVCKKKCRGSGGMKSAKCTSEKPASEKPIDTLPTSR